MACQKTVASETINAKAGAEFTVRLASNASTGYVWEVQALPEGMELLGSAPEPKPAGEVRPGDPTPQVFRFRSQKPGKHDLNFVLKRKWEKEPIERKTVTVNSD
jgi:predicted secreted protein